MMAPAMAPMSSAAPAPAPAMTAADMAAPAPAPVPVPSQTPAPAGVTYSHAIIRTDRPTLMVYSLLICLLMSSPFSVCMTHDLLHGERVCSS